MILFELTCSQDNHKIKRHIVASNIWEAIQLVIGSYGPYLYGLSKENHDPDQYCLTYELGESTYIWQINQKEFIHKAAWII